MDTIQRLWGKVPIVGIWAKVPLDSRKKASEESFVSLLIAFAPVLIAAIFVVLLAPGSASSSGSLFSLLLSSLQKGDFVVYATVFVAPVGYMAYKAKRERDASENTAYDAQDSDDHDRDIPFPEAGASLVIVIVFLLIAATPIYAQTFGGELNPVIEVLSYIMVTAALAMNYSANVHKHFTQSGVESRDIIKDETDLLDQWEADH